MVPDIIADARAAIFRATVGGLERTRIRLKPLTPILCGVMLCEWYVINANHIGLCDAITKRLARECVQKGLHHTRRVHRRGK
jgi:hypothetical protein